MITSYNIFFVIVFSCFSTLYSLGQQVQISEPVDVANEVDYELIARYENQVLLYRKTETKFFIQSFTNGDLKQNWVKTIEFNKRDIIPFKIVPHKKSFSILYYYYKRGHTHIRGKEFDTEAQEIDDFDVGVFSNLLVLKRHHIINSQNKLYSLIYSPTQNGNLEVLHFDMVNKKQTWQEELKFDQLNYYRDFQQILINNQGAIFIVYNQYNNKRQRKQHQFSICRIGMNQEKDMHIVPFFDYISYDMNVQYDEINQQLVAAGLYSTKNSVANGIFYFNTNFDEVPTVQMSELEESFMRSLTGKKSKKITGIQNFTICQLVLRKDGGALLVAEQQFSYESSMAFYEEERSKAQADYLFENILVASIHPSGKVYWKDVLFKSQSSENDNGKYSSFFAVKTNSNIRFLYNNDISWDTSIFEYVINSKGHVKRNVVTHQERKNGVLPQLTNSIQVSASEVIALSERNQKLRLLKINY